MASANSSIKVVIAALIGNGLIAITKFVAAFITASSAMLSEAIHSVVDTTNQGLILLGIKRSAKPADKKHPFGYGMEVYFWSFVVAVLIFAVGAGVALYEGIHKIMHPEPLQKVYINYIVLGIAIAIESVAWWIAYKEFNAHRGRLSHLQAVIRSKKAPIFVVLIEDSAAMLGLFIALIGVTISSVYDAPIWDGIASILIAIVLAVVAIFLAYESKSLLIGEAVDQKDLRKINDILSKQLGDGKVTELLTMHMGPDDILVNVTLDYKDNVKAGTVEKAVAKAEKALKAEVPEIKRVFIEIQS